MHDGKRSWSSEKILGITIEKYRVTPVDLQCFPCEIAAQLSGVVRNACG